MKITQVSRLVGCVVVCQVLLVALAAGPLGAEEKIQNDFVPALPATTTVTVQQTLDYTSDDWTYGPWFVEPGYTLDHYPYCRGSNEDWGWFHNVAGLVPPDAIGIQSATLTIIAWKVDAEDGEVDMIYVTLDMPPAPVTTNIKRMATRLGPLKSYLAAKAVVSWPATGQVSNYASLWSTTSFALPSEVLDDLWAYEQLFFFMDIDQLLGDDGFRVTLKDSKLTIKYITTGTPAPEPGQTAPVYRFWSQQHGHHFYTIDPVEKDDVLATYPPEIWALENVAFNAYPEGSQPAGTSAVYRFWSPSLGGHFYTISEAEKDSVLATYPPEIWTFEKIAFYAYPEGSQPAGTSPVHRFWSPLHGGHFYTIDETEKENVLATYPPEIWTYEGVAFFCYPP